MSHLHRILLLATVPLLALPACGTAVDEDWTFRAVVNPPTTGGDDWGAPGLDECILINEPPSGGGGSVARVWPGGAWVAGMAGARWGRRCAAASAARGCARATACAGPWRARPRG